MYALKNKETKGMKADQSFLSARVLELKFIEIFPVILHGRHYCYGHLQKSDSNTEIKLHVYVHIVNKCWDENLNSSHGLPKTTYLSMLHLSSSFQFQPTTQQPQGNQSIIYLQNVMIKLKVFKWIFGPIFFNSYLAPSYSFNRIII